MEVQITIEMEKVMSEVSKHFALIGKRLKDKNGDTMFAKTTLSSEEKGIMKQYINAAAETFVAELSPQEKRYLCIQVHVHYPLQSHTCSLAQIVFCFPI